MRKILVLPLFLLALSFTSCSDSKPTAASIAKDWCDLNGKAHKAEGADKEAALEKRKEFEKDMEAKYKNDKAFMDEIEKEVEKCEDASEGR